MQDILHALLQVSAYVSELIWLTERKEWNQALKSCSQKITQSLLLEYLD